MFFRAINLNQDISTKIATNSDGVKYVAWDTSLTSMRSMLYGTRGISTFNNGQSIDNPGVIGINPLYWDLSA